MLVPAEQSNAIVSPSGYPKGGPSTREGKEVARWNATRHGIRSPAPVVPGVEQAEDWEAHRDGVLESLQPEGHLEMVLAERAALLCWRLHRVIRYETESIALYQEKAQEDLAEQRGRPFTDVSGPASPEVVRSNLKSARMDLKLLKRFTRTEDDEPLTGLDAANILWEVAEHTEAVAEGEAEAEELLENLSVPGLKEGTSPEEFEGWTAGLLHRAVEQIASSADKEGPEAVLEAAMRSAEWKVKKAKQTAEEVERDLRNMARERLLPDETTLQKVARYEAISQEGSTRLYTSSRRCRSGGRRCSLGSAGRRRIGGKLRAGRSYPCVQGKLSQSNFRFTEF
jgi:hypothetical protein